MELIENLENHKINCECETLSSCCSSLPIDEIENMCGACGEITTFECYKDIRDKLINQYEMVRS